MDTYSTRIGPKFSLTLVSPHPKRGMTDNSQRELPVQRTFN